MIEISTINGKTSQIHVFKEDDDFAIKFSHEGIEWKTLMDRKQFEKLFSVMLKELNGGKDVIFFNASILLEKLEEVKKDSLDGMVKYGVDKSINCIKKMMEEAKHDDNC